MTSETLLTCGPQQALCSSRDTLTPYCLEVQDIRQFDCSLIGEQCECPIPQAESDIAGIGVLIAFLFSAFLTLFAAVGYLMLKYRGKQKRTNKIDEWWTTRICLPVQRRINKPHIWAECCLRLTFALSDQQLVTGIAILIAGFKLLGEGRMTAYHFSVVRDLAFFSSESHILSLLALWSEFGSKRLQAQHASGSKRLPVPTVTILRFFFMIVFLGLLLAATWITAYRLHDDWYRCPVRCVLQYSRGLGSVPLRWAIASTIFLVTQYSGLMLQLGESILGRADNLRARIRSFDTRLKERTDTHAFGACVYRALRSTIGGFRFYWFSEFLVILEVLAWFIANCIFAAQNRTASRDVFGYSSDGVGERKKEDDLGFGQIVPLLLLIVPFLTFINTYHEVMEHMHARRRYLERQRAEYELAEQIGWLFPWHA